MPLCSALTLPPCAFPPMQPWHWQPFPLAKRTGSAVFDALLATHRPVADRPVLDRRDLEQIGVLLESPYPVYEFCATAQRLSRYSICAGPPRWWGDRPLVWTPPIGNILPTLRQLRDRRLPPTLPPAQCPEHLPFQGGWLGWLGYDLAWEIEQLPHKNADPLPFPVAFWYEPTWFAVLDHRDQVLWLATTEEEEGKRLGDRLNLAQPLGDQPPGDQPLGDHRSDAWPDYGMNALGQGDRPLTFVSDRIAYEAAVRQAQEHIRAGDIFQANLSLRFATTTPASGWQIYQTLHRINPSPFASYWRTPWGEVASCSPERLVQVSPLESGQGSDPGSDPGSERNSDQNSERNSDQNSERNSDQNSERNSDPGSERNSDQNSERNSDPGSERNSERNSDQDSDPGSNQASEHPSELGSESRSRSGSGLGSGLGSGARSHWRADTRPIAGTRPRGDTPERDRQLAHDLLHHPKERAEHTMLVDLERNDLGRVCVWGSVAVDELLTIERYSHVMHLVSNVTGQLAGDRDAIDLIAAVFPGGTITGCPKVRCMEIIETLEPVRRSLFYGSLGYLDHRGSLDLNITIRTLLLSHPQIDPAFGVPLRQVWGQVGAGIVADSDPGREWEESLSKAAAQWTALQHTHSPTDSRNPPPLRHCPPP